MHFGGEGYIVSVRYEVGLLVDVVPKITQYWWFLNYYDVYIKTKTLKYTARV